ncbi:hypothetical protein COLO4_37724 [Corchorus olitorius]|uniref:Uncharacterized protein n=1 Tax=Corchorus olitorius TaxID=93759 RepID=A0A1R3FZN8_9ROSI|nr:hypothetical protein COLO4_37724 [Corchorus olitorius]
MGSGKGGFHFSVCFCSSQGELRENELRETVEWER